MIPSQSRAIQIYNIPILRQYNFHQLLHSLGLFVLVVGGMSYVVVSYRFFLWCRFLILIYHAIVILNLHEFRFWSIVLTNRMKLIVDIHDGRGWSWISIHIGTILIIPLRLSALGADDRRGPK